MSEKLPDLCEDGQVLAFSTWFLHSFENGRQLIVEERPVIREIRKNKMGQKP